MRQRLLVPAVTLSAMFAIACGSSPTGPTPSASSAPPAQGGVNAEMECPRITGNPVL